MTQKDNNPVDQAVAEGGAYEVIRKRLTEQGQQLQQQAKTLNEARLSEFGASDMDVIARVRVRTEHNCMARDIVQVGDLLVFGYNVFIGLKKEVKVEDVFAVFTLQEKDDSFELQTVPLKGSFLDDNSFRNDMEELYRYYKNTRLIQLMVKDGKLLASFQIGERLEDIRVFRWALSADGKQATYMDNRGERDIQLQPRFDFEWAVTEREHFVNGRHPHVNILDTVFIETVGGDLTIKVENNTEDGLGVYREPVEDKTQSLDDAEIHYAKVGNLILLKALPYRETDWRYFVFNTLTQSVSKIDGIGKSCVQLPEDHGIIFPGGYYLQTGEYKTYEDTTNGLQFKRMIRSPNGEDVLYVFYEPVAGEVALFAYNLISKSLQNPIYGHGYALFEDGKVVIFSAESEPTRIHPMQIWQTPYVSQEFASQVPTSQTPLGKIGNAELVRGISDLYSLCRSINQQQVSMQVYEDLNNNTVKLFDAYYWLSEPELKQAGMQGIDQTLNDIADTAELVMDEFEKVESIRQKSATAMHEAEQQQTVLLQAIRPDDWQLAEEFVTSLSNLRQQRGHLATIRDYRYIDVEHIQVLENELLEHETNLSQQTVDFLAQEKALEPYLDKISDMQHQMQDANSKAALQPLLDNIEETASGLDLLSELMTTLKVDDATLRTRIIDTISQVYAQLNQTKARAQHQAKEFGSEEAVAQFAAQFNLFSQSITNALGLATTPARCDEQLSRLLVQLEELESQFSDYDQFLNDIIDKRDEVYEAFEGHKQQLLDEQQRKAQSISDAADRILRSIDKRSLQFTDADQLNTYFAADALVLKTRDLVEQLRELDSAVKADDVEARFKASKEQALRSLRDKTDIFEDGGNVIKLGPRHKFSVNTQELDLTIIPRQEALTLHLSGTDYYQTLNDEKLIALNPFWSMQRLSENTHVYRGEYLADSVLQAAQQQHDGLSMATLTQALNEPDTLMTLVRDFASPRYQEGYDKGVHDHDASLILQQLLPALQQADLLYFDPLSRGLAQVFWANIKFTKTDRLSYQTWQQRAQSAAQMQDTFANCGEKQRAAQLLSEEIQQTLTVFLQQHPIQVDALTNQRAADYLVAELGRDHLEFISSKYAQKLAAQLKHSLSDDAWRRFQSSLKDMQGWPAERWQLTSAWLQVMTEEQELHSLQRYIPEAVALINGDERISRRHTEADLQLEINGLLGDHPRIEKQCLQFDLDDFLCRLEHHRQQVIPAYQDYLTLRHDITQAQKDTLRLDSFKAKPLSSFVRNRLINEAYLPIIGDNLAKQMGTVGDSKRTDLMGLLMMISPPGYGKTTLMEYVANRLGLIFMKINCPSLGHDVLSLDPEQAPNATAKQELEKINLAFEMGNNVMLYLDDIQHTHPEFLQKYISLCDGTRRVEGVWQGQTKTYDMRGKKFCVVMAGNPYTESGEAFKVPDMLANRADIYNLGDILGGMDEQFALSYIENCLTSNTVLAPLALRDMQDVYQLVRLAQGDNIATTDLSHAYSGAEVNEITDILKKLFVIQDVVLKINQQYIASAAQDDKYRTEPSFKLQGSYRNMNKMAEKVSAVMNQDELMQLIADHYQGEAQMLTSGAEANLLKLAELRGNMTEAEQQRWQQIKQDFLRNKAMGGDETDTGNKIVTQMMDLVAGIEGLSGHLNQTEQQQAYLEKITDIGQALQTLNKQTNTLPAPNIEVINQPLPGMDKVLQVMADSIEHTIAPLVAHMNKKLDVDLNTLNEIKELTNDIHNLRTQILDKNIIRKKRSKKVAKKTNNDVN